jgi:hypothetical protein
MLDRRGLEFRVFSMVSAGFLLPFHLALQVSGILTFPRMNSFSK